MGAINALSPVHISLIEPLLKWKILGLPELQKITTCPGTRSNLYKKIERLEKEKFIGSFIDPFTKKKFIFLDRSGLNFFAEDLMTPINHENAYHDSLSSEFGFLLSRYSFVKNVLMEHSVLKSYPLIRHRPDGIIEGIHHKKEFKMAFEIELTIKNKKRILETFSFYNNSEYFNNVIYVFGMPQVYETYLRVFRESQEEFNKEKFLFLILPKLYQRSFDFVDSEVTYLDRKTTLGAIFKISHLDAFPLQGSDR